MTVSSELSSVSYSGDGSTTAFPVPYYFLENSHLQLLLVQLSNGSVTPLAEGSDYTVTGAGNLSGGSVTTFVAPAVGFNLYINRNVPATQETDYVANDPFPAESHERALDKLTMIAQQVNTNASGAIRVAIGDPEPARLPPAAVRADMLMGFSSTGDPIPVSPVDGSTAAFALLLANAVNPSQGAAMIGRNFQVVKSIAELKTLLIGSPSKNAFVTGYYAQGDGGGGAYHLDISDITSADNGGSIIVAVDGGRWKLDSVSPRSVKQFGAKGDGAANDRPAFLAAYAAPGTFGLYVPAGTYIISGGGITLGQGQGLLGESSASSIIKTTQATGDVVTMVGFGSRVENMQFDASVVRTAGRYINSAVARTYIRNIEIYNYFTGIALSSAYTFVENISINTCSVDGDGYGIHIYGGNDQFIRNVIVDNTEIKAPFAGIYVTQCGGAKISNCDFIRCKVGVYLNSLDGANVSAIDFTDIYCDTSINNAYILSCTGTGWMYYNTFTNCWAASAKNMGWAIGGGTGIVDGVFMVNTRSINNGLDGVSLGTGVRNVTMSGGQIGGNSQKVANVSAGVLIAANVSDVAITGMRIGGTVQNFSDQQKYSISVGAGSGDRIVITGNDLRTTNAGVGAQPLIFGATGTSNIIDNNPGVNTRGFFTGTTDGAGNVVVTHAAGFVPRGVLTSNMNNATAQFCQPDAPNNLNFRVNFRNTAGAPITGTGVNFAWHIIS